MHRLMDAIGRPRLLKVDLVIGHNIFMTELNWKIHMMGIGILCEP
jgi:hypothetical protein